MFQVGELIIYGTTGVCRVEEIAMRDLSGKGEKKQFYILRSVYQDCIISTPVESDKVFMRPIITKEEAQELVDQIAEVQSLQLDGLNMREQTERYEAVIKTHDCRTLVSLIRCIFEKKQALEQQKRKFGAVDERYLRRAEQLLHGELAAALGMEQNEIAAHIAKCIEGEASA